MLWRGAIDWPQFLTGRSMVIAGGMEAKLVIYPIADDIDAVTERAKRVIYF